MPKKITIEKLAQISQREFTAIREEMQKGFKNTDLQISDVRQDIADVRQEVKQGFIALTEIFKSIQSSQTSQAARQTKMELDVLELKARVRKTEEKLGLAK